MTTKQIETWSGEFGRAYTERNRFADQNAFNQLYLDRYGRSRDDIYGDWLKDIPRDAPILEIGANIGNQLGTLQRLGFTRLSGLEIQRYAIEESKKLYSGLDIILGSGLDNPFKDNQFELVFTNNVLIHIAPRDLPRMLSEVHRVSRSRILGFEYFAPEIVEISYRGHQNLLWKADYSRLYRDWHPDLVVEREQRFPCLDEPGNVDNLFLLKKR